MIRCIIWFVFGFLLCISCKRKNEKDIINSYTVNNKFSLVRSNTHTKVFFDHDISYIEINQLKKDDVIELKSYKKNELFGDRVYFNDELLYRYMFMVNDTTSTYDVEFDNNGKIKYEYSTPIQYQNIGFNSTKDSGYVEMILPKVIYKNVSLRLCSNGKSFQEITLNNNVSKYSNNYVGNYTFLLPLKNSDKNTMICLYRTIKCLTIYNERRVYNDTLCYYINDKYLR